MMVLWVIGYIWIASTVTAVISVINEGKTVGDYTAAFTGVFWLPVGVGAAGFALLIAIPYKLTKLILDKLKKVW